MEKIYKVRVSFVVKLSEKQRKDCLSFAESMGLGFGNPKQQTLLKRLFEDSGQSGVLTAQECVEADTREDEQ